jgi:uncharacterized protein YdaL
MPDRFDFFPFVDTDANEANLTQGRYEVYVNGDFVGYKTLFSPKEEIVDIGEFLHNQGFSNVTAKVDGDHYEIHAGRDSAEKVKQVLEMYWQQR